MEALDLMEILNNKCKSNQHNNSNSNIRNNLVNPKLKSNKTLVRATTSTLLAALNNHLVIFQPARAIWICLLNVKIISHHPNKIIRFEKFRIVLLKKLKIYEIFFKKVMAQNLFFCKINELGWIFYKYYSMKLISIILFINQKII